MSTQQVLRQDSNSSLYDLYLYFPLPYVPRGWKVTHSEAMGPALTIGQEASQCEEALHLWGSGKENMSHDTPIR